MAKRILELAKKGLLTCLIEEIDLTIYSKWVISFNYEWIIKLLLQCIIGVTWKVIPRCVGLYPLGYKSTGRSRGHQEYAPLEAKFLIFMRVLGKNGQVVCSPPPRPVVGALLWEMGDRPLKSTTHGGIIFRVTRNALYQP